MIKFTTFIDRDALEAIKNYLVWEEKHHGTHDPEGPLFTTIKGRPIYLRWISNAFSRMANYSRMQRQLTTHVLKIRAHKVRHLLKSTLMANGCSAWAADHFLGHAPKDVYEGPAELFPKALRNEYAKASHMINILSKAASKIDDTVDPDAVEKALKASEAKVEGLINEVNELKAVISKKGATNTGTESRFNMLVQAIIDASEEPGVDFKKSLKEKLDDLF